MSASKQTVLKGLHFSKNEENKVRVPKASVPWWCDQYCKSRGKGRDVIKRHADFLE